MKAQIGIIGAMQLEVEGLIASMKDAVCESVSGIDFHIGEICGKQVVVARGGVGKVFAALCTEAMILKYSPELIVNTGVGGALTADLSTGDIIIAEALCQYDMDTSPVGDPVGLISGINKIYFETDRRAVEILLDAADERGLHARVGKVATGDKFVASKEQKEAITALFDADVCEMEGAAVAHAAYVNNTPLAVVRAISDSADGGVTMDYPAFLPLAAANSQSLTTELIKKW